MKIVDQLVEFYRQQNVAGLQAQVTTLNEGGETPEFWDALGVVDPLRLSYINEEFYGQYPNPRLFITSVENGNLKIREIPEFTQNDLEQEFIYILDTGKEIFQWIGNNCGEVHKNLSNATVDKFVAHRQAQNQSIKLHKIQSGENLEPPEFTRHFYAWNFKEHLLDPRQRSYLRFLEKKKLEEQEQARLEAEQEKERQRLQQLQATEAAQQPSEPLVWVEIPTVAGPQVWQVRQSQATGLKVVPAPATPQAVPHVPGAAVPPAKAVSFKQKKRRDLYQAEVDTVVGRSSWLVKNYAENQPEEPAEEEPVEEEQKPASVDQKAQGTWATPVEAFQQEEVPQVDTPSTPAKEPEAPAAAAKPAESEKPMSRAAKKKAAKKKAAAKKQQEHQKEAKEHAEASSESTPVPAKQEYNTTVLDNASSTPEPALIQEPAPVETAPSQPTEEQVAAVPAEEPTTTVVEATPAQQAEEPAAPSPVQEDTPVEAPAVVEEPSKPSKPAPEPTPEPVPAEPIEAKPEPVVEAPQPVKQPENPTSPTPAEGGKKKRKNKKKGKNVNNNAQQQQHTQALQPAKQAPVEEAAPTPVRDVPLVEAPAPQPVEQPQEAPQEEVKAVEVTSQAEATQEATPAEPVSVPEVAPQVEEPAPQEVPAEVQPEPIEAAASAPQPSQETNTQQEPSAQEAPAEVQSLPAEQPAESTEVVEQPAEPAPLVESTPEPEATQVVESQTQQPHEEEKPAQPEPQQTSTEAQVAPQEEIKQAAEESQANGTHEEAEEPENKEAAQVASPATGRKKKRKNKKKK